MGSPSHSIPDKSFAGEMSVPDFMEMDRAPAGNPQIFFSPVQFPLHLGTYLLDFSSLKTKIPLKSKDSTPKHHTESHKDVSYELNAK